MWKRGDPEKDALVRENQALRHEVDWMRAHICSLGEQAVSLHQVLARQVQEAAQRSQEALVGQIKTMWEALVSGELDYSLQASDTVAQWDAAAWLSWLAAALRAEMHSLQADRDTRECQVEALRKENEALGQQLSDCLDILDYWEEAQLLLEQRLYDTGIPNPWNPRSWPPTPLARRVLLNLPSPRLWPWPAVASPAWKRSSATPAGPVSLGRFDISSLHGYNPSVQVAAMRLAGQSFCPLSDAD